MAASSRYHLRERIGKGGNGEVWRALHAELGVEVAVKFLRADRESDPEASLRLLREARALSAIRHPNVVTVHDVGRRADGAVFIVMELIEGSTLSEVLQAGGAMEFRDAKPILLQIADALHHVHTLGVLHRDLKPSNILLSEVGGERIPYLIDFGLAKRVRVDAAVTAVTLPGALCGTPLYLAPEVILGQQPTPASDVYALGCLAYEVLVGRPPMAREGVLEVLSAHLFERPPSLSLRGAHARKLSKLIELALAKDAAKRPASASAFAALLREISVAEVTSPDRPGNGVSRWSRIIVPALAIGASVASAALAVPGESRRSTSPLGRHIGMSSPPQITRMLVEDDPRESFIPALRMASAPITLEPTAHGRPASSAPANRAGPASKFPSHVPVPPRTQLEARPEEARPAAAEQLARARALLGEVQ